MCADMKVFRGKGPEAVGSIQRETLSFAIEEMNT